MDKQKKTTASFIYFDQLETKACVYLATAFCMFILIFNLVAVCILTPQSSTENDSKNEYFSNVNTYTSYAQMQKSQFLTTIHVYNWIYVSSSLSSSLTFIFYMCILIQCLAKMHHLKLIAREIEYGR